MALAKALGGGFPVGAFLTTKDAGKGMTAGTHGSTFGGNPLAMAAGNATLDVMLEPGFLDRVKRIGLLFKQRLAEIKDRYPSIIAEVRGEGLLLGLRCVIPNGQLVDALRDEHLLAVGAGENVVRLVPPLIVSEDGGRRGDGHARPRLRASRARARTEEGSRDVSASAPRHFLDLTEIPVEELRGMIEQSRAMKRVKRAGGTPERPLAGKTLAMIFDKPSTRTRVSFDVAMRQLGGDVVMLTGQEMQLGRGETIADTARVLSRYVDAIMIRILNHESLIELARHATVPVINGLTRHFAPVPGHGRRDDVRGAQRQHQGPHRRVDRRRQQRAVVVDACGEELRLPPQGRDAAGTQARPRRSPHGRSNPARDRDRARSGSRGRRAPTASSPTPGCRWATRTARSATTCSSPTRSMRG